MTMQRLGSNWLALGLVAGALGIAVGACTKVEDDGKNSTSGNGGATATTKGATGGKTGTTTATTSKGGTTSTATATATNNGGTSATITVPAGGASTGTTAGQCPDLLKILSPGEAGVCSTSKVAAKFSQINMLIVVDKSGSMSTVPNGYQKTKWAGAVDSLKTALTPSDTLIKYGMLLFPYSSTAAATSCELATGETAVNIPVGVAAETVPKINDLMGTTTPGGGTPTAAALASALDYYTSGAGVLLEGQKYVLLVTDGGPNCNAGIACLPGSCTANMDNSPAVCGKTVANCCDVSVKSAQNPNPQTLCLDDQNVLTKIQALAAEGIKTFVVGIPGTEAYAGYLDAFATAGGVPVTDPAKTHKYYEVTGENGLLDTFNTITTSLVRSCTVPLEQAPQDLSNINVAIDCSPVPQTTGGVPNWHYDETAQSIVIEGGQCTHITSKGVNRVDVVLGCVPFVIN